jgi:HEAT repeat protein
LPYGDGVEKTIWEQSIDYNDGGGRPSDAVLSVLKNSPYTLDVITDSIESLVAEGMSDFLVVTVEILENIGLHPTPLQAPLGPQAVQSLLKLLMTTMKEEWIHEEIHETAFGALDRLGWKPDTDELRAFCMLAKGHTKELAKWGKTAVQPLIKALSDDEEWVRQTAARALGVIGDARAVVPLIKALGDGNKHVRGYAASALDKLEWKPDTDEFRAAYLIASNDWKSLVEWGEPAVQWLIEALRDEDGDVSWHAASALGEIGDARAVEPLIKALRDEDGDVSWHAASALGEIGDARAVEPLIKALRDNSSAAKALVNIGDARAVEPLIKALGDKDSDVRQRGAEALGEIGDERAVEPLIAALSVDGAYVRYSAAEALGQYAKEALKMLEKRGKLGESAVEPMIKLLTNSNLGARNYAASMLGKMGDRRAVKPLIEVLGSDKLSVIKTAAGALGKLGNERAVEPLIKTFEDGNLGVIKVAAKTIVKIKEADIGDEEKKNILKFLKSKDPAMVLMGASMLKGILEK